MCAFVVSAPISHFHQAMNSSGALIYPDPIVVLIGPTAIGKTALSIELAQEFDCEIIGVDSMQVYRYMNIGTAKITTTEMQGIGHHLIDVVSPNEAFDASSYEKMALDAVKEIQGRGKRVLITGGTGLYLKALLHGLSSKIPAFPEIRKELEQQLKRDGGDVLHKQLSLCDRISADRIHINDHHRLVRGLEIYRGTGKPWSTFITEQTKENVVRFPNTLQLALTCDRALLYRRIEQRTEIMLQQGFEEEVRGLLSMGYGSELKSMQSIGYSHMLHYINGDWSRDKMTEGIRRDTRRYAKRQYTWFNKIPALRWIDTAHKKDTLSLCKKFFSPFNS